MDSGRIAADEVFFEAIHLHNRKAQSAKFLPKKDPKITFAPTRLTNMIPRRDLKANFFQPTQKTGLGPHVFHVFTPQKRLRNAIATFLLTYQSHKMELVINGHRNVQGAPICWHCFGFGGKIQGFKWWPNFWIGIILLIYIQTTPQYQPIPTVVKTVFAGSLLCCPVWLPPPPEGKELKWQWVAFNNYTYRV